MLFVQKLDQLRTYLLFTMPKKPTNEHSENSHEGVRSMIVCIQYDTCTYSFILVVRSIKSKSNQMFL